MNGVVSDNSDGGEDRSDFSPCIGGDGEGKDGGHRWGGHRKYCLQGTTPLEIHLWSVCKPTTQPHILGPLWFQIFSTAATIRDTQSDVYIECLELSV